MSHDARPMALVGTTASGKSAAAMALARTVGDVEIVSVDSMQVYRGMDIGTAKPSPADRAEVPHHVIDVVDPWDEFEVHSFQTAVNAALADIASRGKRSLLVGGTGLYLRAVVDGLTFPGRYPLIAADLAADPDTAALYGRLSALDPEAASRMEPTNRRRVIRALEVCLGSSRRFSSFGPGLETYPPSRFDLVGIWLPRSVVAERIAARYGDQLQAGFVDEVRRLAAEPRPLSRTAARALGYQELLAQERGLSTLPEAIELAISRTRRFARRQRVWFRRDPRITWIGSGCDPSTAVPALVAHARALWA